MKRIYWYSFWGIAVLHLLSTWGAMLKSFSINSKQLIMGGSYNSSHRNCREIQGITKQKHQELNNGY